VEEALEDHPGLRHIKVADASGKRLGRSFGVKLWPTLVFLKDGVEVARAVRPRDAEEIRAALAKLG
jgi:thioredoxin 1